MGVCSHCSIDKVEISNVDSLPSPFMYQRHLKAAPEQMFTQLERSISISFGRKQKKKVRVGYKTHWLLSISSANSKAGRGPGLLITAR